MKNVVRTVPLSQEAMNRVQADLEAGDVDTLAKMLAELFVILELRKVRTWQELARLAQVDPKTEYIELSFITNEILVMAKSPTDSDTE